jgi:MraZ protein
MDDGGTTKGGEEEQSVEPRFWGTHEHALDAKGRVILPARFREPFRQGVFLTKLPEGCLGVWTPQEFERRTAAMLEKGRQGQAERNVARVWAAGAFDTAPDGQGRIAIPPQLRAYAQLDAGVMVNGAINHVELWDTRKWSEIDAEGSQYLLSGTDALDDIGF